MLLFDAFLTFRACLCATQRNLADEAVRLYMLALAKAADEQQCLFQDALETFRASLDSTQSKVVDDLVRLYILVLERAIDDL